MGSFLKTASKQVSDVRNFLRDAAGSNSIKYAPEKGTKHIIYIPYTSQQRLDEATGQQVVVKELCAITQNIHEWTTADGKYKAVVCLKDVIRTDENGNQLNNGVCPFCERVSDGWDIYRYRKEKEEETCQLTGDQRKNHLEQTNKVYRDERKAKEARPYMYILVVKFRIGDKDTPILGADGLPEYDLKVMKLSASRVEKIQQQVTNSGAELPGSELIMSYPSVDDRRLLVSQSTTSLVFPNSQFTIKYPNLINKINEDVAKFDWDGVDKAFTEWQGMTTSEAQEVNDKMFEQWDQYKKELTVNPNAKYLEYVVSTPTAKPSLTGVDGVPGAAPGIPVIPSVPNVPPVPNVEAPAGAAPVLPIPPVAPATDPNAVFGGAESPVPTINV